MVASGEVVTVSAGSSRKMRARGKHAAVEVAEEAGAFDDEEGEHWREEYDGQVIEGDPHHEQDLAIEGRGEELGA